MNESTGKLILRVTLGVLILLHGIAKLMNGIDWLDGMLANAGLPGFLKYGVYVGEVLAPLAVIAGFYSRIGAWASPQSQVISGRSVLVANAAKYGAQFLLNPPRPPHWGGFRLVPERWEFWQGRKSRLHDRLCYQLESGTWLRQRLAP